MTVNFEGGAQDIPTYSLADLRACVERGDESSKEFFRRNFNGKVVILGEVQLTEDRKVTSKRFAAAPERPTVERCALPPPAATEFVARFVGSANVIKGVLADRLLRRPGCFAVRAEDIEIRPASGAGHAGTCRCTGTVIDVQFRGSASRVRVNVGDGAVLHVELTGGSAERIAPAIGAPVELSWPERALVPLRESA